MTFLIYHPYQINLSNFPDDPTDAGKVQGSHWNQVHSFSGTVPDANLSANVVLENAANTFTTGVQTINTGEAAIKGLIIKGVTAQTANLQEWQLNTGTAIARVTAAGQFSNPTAGTGADCEAFGSGALSSNTTGEGNVAFGVGALSANTTGNFNMAFSRYALAANISGSYNVAQGDAALFSNTIGGGNIAIGAYALFVNDSDNNTAIGNQSLTSNTGSANTGLGGVSLAANTTGSGNAAIGFNALSANTTGQNNIGIGNSTGATLTTGSNNTLIGVLADAASSAANQAIALGAAAIASDNQLAISPYITRETLFGLSSTNATRERGEIQVAWIDNTDASRKARLILGIYDTVFREAVRMDTDGSRALIGLGGVTPTARLHLPAGSATANTAPLKLASGTLLTTAEAGAIEFLTDAFYGTITTGAARRTFAMLESAQTWTAPQAFGVATVKAGTSLTQAKAGGVIFDRFADVGNVGTGEDTLCSETIPANFFSANGDKLIAEYAGIFVSSATATRRLRLYFDGAGATLIYDSTALSLSTSADWNVKIVIIRESSTVVRCSVSVNTTTASSAPYTTYTRITGLTLSSATVLKLTAESAGAGAADNDIVAKLGYGEWKSAA